MSELFFEEYEFAFEIIKDNNVKISGTKEFFYQATFAGGLEIPAYVKHNDTA